MVPKEIQVQVLMDKVKNDKLVIGEIPTDILSDSGN
jgi:hypothetical protein